MNGLLIAKLRARIHRVSIKKPAKLSFAQSKRKVDTFFIETQCTMVVLALLWHASGYFKQFYSISCQVTATVFFQY